MQNTRANETHSYTPNDKYMYISLGYATHWVRSFSQSDKST